MTTIDGIQTGVTSEDTNLLTSDRGMALSVVLAPDNWSWGGLLEGIKGSTGLPAPGTRARDVILRGSVLLDDMWASAVRKACTKHAAQGYTVEDTSDTPRRLEYAQRIVASYDGRDFYRGVQKGLRDYLTTNNGQFVYIERSGARVTALHHLDSLRCSFYPHPAYPVLYHSPVNGQRLLEADNIIHLSALPNSDPAMYNTGLCAADTLWSTLMKAVSIETYLREKVSGQRNLAIHFITGVNTVKLREALNASDSDAAQQGYVVYRGSTIIPMLPGGGGETPTLITIPLAEIPDGFNAVEERRDYYNRLANAVGIFVGELQPLSGQGLGTGTQAIVLDEAAEGQGLAEWGRRFFWLISDRALPATSTVKPAHKDLRDQKLKAEVQKLRADMRAARIASGELTTDEARQIAFDDGDLPQELFAAVDRTSGGQLEDTQKPVDTELIDDAEPAPVAPSAPTVKATKPTTDVVITADDLATARQLLKRLRLNA